MFVTALYHVSFSYVTEIWPTHLYQNVDHVRYRCRCYAKTFACVWSIAYARRLIWRRCGYDDLLVYNNIPSWTRRTYVGLMLNRCRRRWINFQPAYAGRLIFSESLHWQIHGTVHHMDHFYHCAVELFASIFHSFEAGIADAISSSKWRKIFIFMKNRHF